MSSIEVMAAAWVRHAWAMAWVFTVACGLIIVLRRPLRHVFGVESLPLLWLLIPLALLAAELPHPVAPITAMPPVVVRIAGTAAAWAPTQSPAASGIHWQVLVMLAWLTGALGVIGLIGVAQWRFTQRLRSARQVEGATAGFPLWRATQCDLGPAMVGAWRVRIVLPADFEARYAPSEQALILAHEQTHARRFDGLWRLLALGFAVLFWFHPLAWYALACLSLDQELACDASVLREHGASRREYARAMLKTQVSSLVLPVGCSWSSRHPLTERVAMLKLPVPTRLRRLAARTVLGAIIVSGSLSVYAAQSASSLHHPSAAAVKEAMALFQGTKMAVTAYWSSHHGFDLPVDNPAAKLPDATLITGKDVAGVEVDHGKLTARLKESAGGGHVVLAPLANGKENRLDWRCESPDIPEIARLSTGCVYAPMSASTAIAPVGLFTLKLDVSVGGRPANLHSTTCLKDDEDAYRFVNGEDKSLAPWNGRLAVAKASGDQIEVRAELAGGSLLAPIHPVIRMHVGQRGAIQVGKVVEGVDQTLRLDVMAWPGCGVTPAVADDGTVHARFRGPSARLMAATFAARAGLTLLDPESIDNTQPVAGNFEGVDPREAMRLIGNVVGMVPVITDSTVRFVAK